MIAPSHITRIVLKLKDALVAKSKTLGRPPIEDKAKRVNIRLYAIDRNNLKKISIRTLENNSQIIRRLIAKESNNK